MKKKDLLVLFAAAALAASAMPARAETVADAINRRLGVNLNNVSLGEFGKMQLQPKQFPEMVQKQQLQAPQKMELQANIQAPSKLTVVRRAKGCSLIPGRAHRMARRAARQQLRAQAALAGNTLLEFSGRTVMEGAACSTCNLTAATSIPAATSTIARTSRPARESDMPSGDMPIRLTSLTTRELLEGGSIRQQVFTVNEPGVCGGGGGGGRRGLFGRRG